MIKPDGLGRLCGARWREDLMPLLQKGVLSPGVSSVSLSPAMLCILGLVDQAWRQGILRSLYFRAVSREEEQEGRISWEYSTAYSGAFQELWVRDGTGNLSHSGIVMFEPPSDMKQAELEGVWRYWIRLRGRKREPEGARQLEADRKPSLPGCSPVHNRGESAAAEDYYIDTVLPGQALPLYGDNSAGSRSMRQ